mmetsp:Transcript_4537/g.12656  ORF Transcript_4537/g.12656 Transcript_4537/m.12656 type:complete len:108 (-) Transcript_4537:100-423(-)
MTSCAGLCLRYTIPRVKMTIIRVSATIEVAHSSAACQDLQGKVCSESPWHCELQASHLDIAIARISLSIVFLGILSKHGTMDISATMKNAIENTRNTYYQPPGVPWQ